MASSWLKPSGGEPGEYGWTWGSSPVGASQAFVATFETVYETGRLAAIARAELVTATGPLLLRVESDAHTIGRTDDDLAFVGIDLVDHAGTLNPSETRLVSVTVDGPGVLQGLASGDPKPDERLVGKDQSTYNGRLLAVISPTGPGPSRSPPPPTAANRPASASWSSDLVLSAEPHGSEVTYDGFVNALLRSVWEEPRPANRPPVRWLDWALVGVLVPTAVLEGVLRPDVSWRIATIVIAVGLIPTLLWRRSHPLLVVAIAFGGCGLAPLLMNGHQPDLNVFAFMLMLAYALFRWGSGREIVLGSAIILAKLGFTLALDQLGPMETFGGVGVLAAAGALGVAVRYRATARQRQLEKVKLFERERLARDLHDTVAHHVSAMAIRAQAGLATAKTEPDAAVDALRLIEAEASKALAEMRGMVRLLRKHEPADRSPSPGIRELELLASQNGSDPHVGVDLAGELDDLPPPVVTALYRLAQEAVTNARRHARHATRIDVSVAVDDRSVRLRVTDDGDASATRPQGSPGFGLIGMAERAGLLGGTCEAGPDPQRERGWTVSAVLPRAGVAAG